jgi:hypothetical protein
MRHILTVERDNGTFPEVGGNSRWVITAAARATAVRIATESSVRYRRRVRVESYADHEFYKPDAMPLTTIVGRSCCAKI